MAAHSWVSLYLNISCELIFSGNNKIRSTRYECVRVFKWIHVIGYIVALINLCVGFIVIRYEVFVFILHFNKPCAVIALWSSINEVVGASGIKANDEQEGIEEDELENCLADNVAPHHWGEDRVLARIGSLVKKSIGWFFCC